MNLEERISHLLKHGKLRTTNTRRRVLKEFLALGNIALSGGELEKVFRDRAEENGEEKMDRITLYRTLRTFEEAGIIHQAVDTSGKMKFALCSEDCTTDHHEDSHAHFHCKNCEKTVCLNHVTFPVINLPKNFQLQDQQLVLSGICDECAA